MNNVMLGAMMVSIWEILIALLVLLVMAGVVGGVIVLVVWLTRRGAASMPDKAAIQLSPPPPAPARRQGRKFTCVEERGGKVRIRWWVCCGWMVVGVLASALVLELFLRVGGWRNERVWVPAIVAGVGSVCAWLIYEFSQAKRARAAANTAGKAASAPVSPVRGRTVGPAACPRCGAVLPAETPQGLCPRCVLGVGLATQTEATGESGPHGTKVVQPPPEPAEIAKHFPQLDILECLGRGGMGVVYKARQPKLNRLVALKILAPEKGADPKFAERFLREAQALARLNHPNIVTVHDFGEAEGLYYLLMEYVDGMTLRQLLHGQKIAPEEALSIVPKICEALQFAHEKGVVHRDIKPENVLVDRQGRVKIADFGIAKIVGADQPRQAITQDQVIGTPHYMAPEQVEKPQLVDHRADIYSLGVVFYEMLTGELPLGKFQPPSKKVQVDVRLDEVVLHALEKEPERRYQRASEVKTAVETIAATPGAAIPAATPAAPPAITPAMIGQYGRHLRVKAACFFFAAVCFLIATVSYTASDNTLAALLSAVATASFGIAGYRHFCAAQRVGASGRPPGGSPPPPAGAAGAGGEPVRILRWRDAWMWNWEYIQLFLIVPLVVVGLALPVLLPRMGLKALWLLAAELGGIAFAITYAIVGRQVRRARAEVPRTERDVAECLMFRRPFQSPGVAVMHEDRLELIPIVGSPIIVPLADIVAIKEVRWFNGTRLWFKKGFVMDLANGQRVGVAVAEAFARRWRAKLSRGTLPEIPAGGGMDQGLRAWAAARIKSRFSRAAIWGLIWLLICVMAQVWSYTPPGWAFNQALRGAFGEFLTEGVKALFVVVGFAAPVGVTVMGWVASTEIRRSGGRVRGLGLAFGEMVLFPLLALDAWLLWLCSQTGLKLVVGAAVAVAADILLIYWAWRWVHRPLIAAESAPVRAEDDLAVTVSVASQLWRVARRAALVAASSLLLLETLLQLEVGWRESIGELWTMALYSACLAAMVWAAWPLRRQPWTVLLRAGGAFALFAAVSLASYFYSWHLRPNLGLYREAGWVAQHPAFQREWRRRIEKNLWRKPAVGPTEATPFGAVTERVLYSVDAQQPIKAEDLDTGREIELSAQVAENSEKDFFYWLAVQGADLLAFAHKQSWELWASPKLAGVPQAMWEKASGEELLKALRSGVMGLGRASMDVKEGFASYQVNESMVLPQTFAFQTQAGALGVLQITDFTESPRGVKIRYRLAQSTGRSVAASGGETERVPQKFVRLVVDKAAMTFEGQPTTWEGVGALLEQVPDRTNTVLEFAVTSDQITVQQQNEWFGKCIGLARTHGFKFASFIGIHELGSRGTGAASSYVTATLAGVAEAKTDQDFVAQHRAELGQKALDAARAFVEEHKWKMQSEWGNQLRVVLKATDPAGKQITFEEAATADGTARFTIIAEPGAELAAQRIGAAIWRRLGWVHVSPAAPKPAVVAPVARAKAGTYQVTLANGITVEVVAVARNPLVSWLWWKPDGTPLPQPPGEAREFQPAGMWTRKSVGSNDCAILVRHGGQLTPNWRRGQQYTPRGEFIGHFGVKGVGMADVLWFPVGTKEVAMHVATAADRPWEAVAVFDGSRTRVLVEGIQVLCTHLRHDADGRCLDVSHNVDRDQYALRMMAKFKSGKRVEVGLHSGVLSGRETQGYVLLDPSEPDLRAGDIAEFVLERTPWVSGEIGGIALAPRLGTTLKPPSFGPVIERELGGWPSLDCTVLDLDQGRLLVVPTNIVAGSMNNPRPLLHWMVERGADLTVQMGAGPALHLDDGVLLRLEGGATFESVAASTVRRQLLGGGGAQNVSIPSAEVKAQPVFVYRTREGGMGALQVLGPSQDPRSLRIRFKAALPVQ